MKHKVTFKDGKLQGPDEHYHENGQLMWKVTFKDGKEDGRIETYHESGQLIRKGTMKNGEQCGEWVVDGETVTYDPC